jgi:large subunit ribosomal protein L18
MATRVRLRTSQKKVARFRRKKRIRSRLAGTGERPRLSVFRSNRHIYVQLIDDTKGHTLVAASTTEEGLKGEVSASIAGAAKVGALVAKRALAKGINKIVFDRSGYLYHGRIKALADAARESGLQF